MRVWWAFTSLDELHYSLPDHLEGLFQRSKKFLNEEEATVSPESTLKTEQLDSGDQLPELQPSRSGRERSRPRHLQDYI